LTPFFGLALTVQRKSLDSYGSARLLIPVGGSTILHQIGIRSSFSFKRKHVKTFRPNFSLKQIGISDSLRYIR